VGTILPVKGMVVLPISLRTGTIVGKPVFTDETGGYTLQVPESVAGNLRVVTRIAVAKASDPIATDNRAQYNLLVDTAKTDTAAPAPAAAIDEDSSVGSQYLRAAFAGRLKDIIVADDADAAAGELVKALGFSETIKTFLSGSVHELNQASKDAGVPSMAAADIDALSGRLTDILLSYVPVYTIMIDPAKYGKWGPEEPAFAGMVDVIKQVRLAATAKMAADPKAFDNAPWMAGAPFPKEIKKPSDVCDFVVANYLVSLNGEKGRTQDAFEGAGVPDAELQAHRINALSIGLLANVGQTLISNPEAKDKMIAAIKASKK
jgi:voltage-gated potassium channel Kch